MGQVKNFLIEVQEAGADAGRAIANLEKGMLWQQAIDEAMPTPEERELEEWLTPTHASDFA